jgi:hypothetical protein
VAVFPTPKPNVGAEDVDTVGKLGVDPKLKAIIYISLAQTEYVKTWQITTAFISSFVKYSSSHWSTV